MNNQKIINIKELDLEIIAPSTKNMYNSDQGGSKTVVIGKPGTGKCLGFGTKIIMFDGSIKEVQNIKVGDKLMGDDSTPRTVLSTCCGEDEMYEVIQFKGENYKVNKPHILSLKYNNEVIDMSVTEYLNIADNKSYKGYKVPIDFPTIEINKDPYEIGKSCTTEIPNLYKINSRKIRLNVLAGILDTNAYYNMKGFFQIISESDSFVRDILYISRSLGYSAYNQEYQKNSNVLYSCYVSGNTDEIPCKTFFKNTKIKNSYLTTGIKLRYLGIDTYYGFEIDGNHRFLLGDFTVTHNTTLIDSLLYYKKHIFPVGMFTNGTETSNQHYKKLAVPDTFIYNEYDEEKIKDFITRQTIAKDNLECPWAVLLLDDCTDDTTIFNKKIQKKLFKLGRHYKMWYILSLQYAISIKPEIRINIDGCFILREPSLKIRKVIWENYASIIPDFGMFCDIMDQLTDDYTALYIHNATNSNTIEDCVFYYKADINSLPKDFKFGSKEYWNFHYDRYNKEYIESF